MTDEKERKMTDGTETAQAKSQIRRTIHANMRHQLRTPLNAIIGYSEMLLEDATEQEQAGFIPDLQKIHAAGNRLLELVDAIIALSEIDGSETTSETADIAPLIQEVMNTVRSVEEEKPTETETGYLLVVDDEQTNRDLLSRRLQREGYTFAVAENGRQALEMISTDSFDLVLLDIMMPEMNGLQVLEYLKADDALKNLPVIMISALDELESVVKCIEMGADDYLPKPFDPVLLKARIDACLEKKRLRDREVAYLQQIEAEKKRADELLHVILPTEIVKELKATNVVKPRRYENVAVLFCDIVGFTPYCDKRQPEEVVSHLQSLFETFENLTISYQMEKIKTVGDEFMATAGLLELVTYPVLNCVKCGLKMVESAQQLPPNWRVRVGIHVGPVVAGVVGHRKYMFDLWGDTVNTASRIQSHGIPDAVHVSPAAWEQIADHCVGESLGLIQLRGKGEMEVFRVDGLITVDGESSNQTMEQ